VLVFRDDGRGDVPFDDFAENAVRHDGLRSRR
jgi:hypothetical protein